MGKFAIIRRAAALGLAAIWLAAAPSAMAATAAGSATAAIVPPLSLVNTRSLSFGNLIPSAAAGTVTIDANTGARSVTGGVTAAGGTVSTAVFQGNAASQSHVKIDVPNSITINRVGGGASMIVNNFTLNVDKNNWQPPGVFSFQVGGSLSVGANQMTGTYNGTFDVTINYR